MNIEIDGLSISYKFTGDGDKTAVVLQGWGTDFGLYDVVANSINSEYRVLQFDFPGFGASPEPPEAWNVDRYADFFCHLMEALGITKAALIGHSYGGRVIIKLASRESIPFEIEKIVLMGSAGIVHKKTFRQKFGVRKYKFLKKLFGLKFIYFLFPEIIDDWRSRQGSADYRNATPVMRNCLVMAVNDDLTDRLEKIDKETLLIWGDKDTATPIGDAKIMEEKIKGSGLVVLEGGTHYCFLEQPQKFTGIMKAFFRIGAAG